MEVRVVCPIPTVESSGPVRSGSELDSETASGSGAESREYHFLLSGLAGYRGCEEGCGR